MCVSVCAPGDRLFAHGGVFFFFLSLPGSDSYLGGPEATGIYQTYIHPCRSPAARLLTAGLWSPCEPPSPAPHFVLKTVQYWLHSTEHTSDKLSMATGPSLLHHLGAAAGGAPQDCRAAGYSMWCCQREPHPSSEHAAIL